MKRLLILPFSLVLTACQTTQSPPSYCEQNPQSSICNVDNYSSDVLSALFKLQDQPKKRAFALFHGELGSEAYGYSYGYSAQADADMQALKECNKRLTKMKLIGECQLIDMTSKAGVNYADVRVSDLTENKLDSNWKYFQKHTPLYPVSLAQNGIAGCAVYKVKINDDGKLEQPELIATNDNHRLNKEASALLKKTQWTPVSVEKQKKAEVKTVRVDYCMGGKSLIEAQALCLKQSQLACSNSL